MEAVNLKSSLENAVPIVELKNITSREMDYLGDNHFSHILKDITFSIYEGEIFGLGSKTINEAVVLSEIIANIRPYYSGECAVLGETLKRKKRLPTERIYYIDSHTMLFDNMTVLEYLMLLTTDKSIDDPQLKLEILEKLDKFGLDYLSLSVIGKLSPTEKILIELFSSLYTNSVLFIVNCVKYEFSGSEIAILKNIANEIKMQKLTMFLVTKQPKIIGIICDKVAYISGGKLLYCGEVNDLIKKKDNIRFLINDSNLKEIYKKLLKKIPEYIYNLTENTLFVIDNFERSENLFLAQMAVNNIIPDRIKVNRGRVENSFERLDNENEL